MLRAVGAGAVGVVGLGGAATDATASEDIDPGFAPAFAGRFLLSPLVPVGFPTAIRFGPGDGGFGDPGAGDDREDLYAATIDGDILRFHIQWTAAGPVVRDRTVAADGFRQPLGVAFHRRGPPPDVPARNPEGPGEGPKGDALLVSDSRTNERTGRIDGRVVLVEEGGRRAIVDGLPNGRHNTNHLVFAPDGRLFIANGNTTDDGCEGGPPEVFPYSGAFLAVDVDEVEDDPAVLRWVDGDGERIPPGAIADHPINESFAETVDVVAHGFRNPYGIAFGPDGVPYAGMNGADVPASQDAFYRLDEPEGTDYRYPFCFDEGPVGATGGDVRLEPNPVAGELDCHVFDDVDDPADIDCSEADHPTADALLGWHVCATGLDFPADGPFAFPDGLRTDAFLAECGTFTPGESAERTTESRDTRNTGHKVTHVAIREGAVTGVRDFLAGLGLPTDVAFGPQGAMYVADIDAIHRIQPTTGGDTSARAGMAGVDHLH